MSKPSARCGTRSGHHAHLRRGESAREEYREALRVARHPGRAAVQRTYQRALKRLAHLHPAEFEALKAQARGKEADLRAERDTRRKPGGW